MIGYYLHLALRGLRRNGPLTALMIAAIGVGVGASVTLYTALQAMSADPIPAKSFQLFNVQVDNWGKDQESGELAREQIAYPDAAGLLAAKPDLHQSPMYPLSFNIKPTTGDMKQFPALARAVTADFFALFMAPFASGGPWSRADDRSHADVVVLGAGLAGRLFPAGDAVGNVITLKDRVYHIVGVLKPWRLEPRVYDLTFRVFLQTEDVIVPFSAAIANQLWTAGGNWCNRPPPPAWDARLASECRWLQYWVELPTAAAVHDYQSFLVSYAQEQRRLGRFHWPPDVGLQDVRQILRAANMTPPGMRVSVFAAFGFLLVCLFNATGLMLARLSGRFTEFSVRRALGASRRQIFGQCLADATLVGVGGGVLSVAVTLLGLAFERHLLREDYARLIVVDVNQVIEALILAVVAMLCAAIYPAWDASRHSPAWKLKAE
jgi:putative ABC transport system permease protein